MVNYHKPESKTIQELRDIAHRLRIHSITSTQASKSGYVKVHFLVWLTGNVAWMLLVLKKDLLPYWCVKRRDARHVPVIRCLCLILGICFTYTWIFWPNKHNYINYQNWILYRKKNSTKKQFFQKSKVFPFKLIKKKSDDLTFRHFNLEYEMNESKTNSISIFDEAILARLLESIIMWMYCNIVEWNVQCYQRRMISMCNALSALFILRTQRKWMSTNTCHKRKKKNHGKTEISSDAYVSWMIQPLKILCKLEIQRHRMWLWN